MLLRGGLADAGCITPPVVRLACTIGHDGTGPPVSCAQAGATMVLLFMNTTRTQLSCDAQSGTSVGLVPGSFTPHVLLVNAQGVVLSMGTLPDVTIPSCGVTNLGNVRFVVN